MKFLWSTYSKRLLLRIETPQWIGRLSTGGRNVHYAESSIESPSRAEKITLYWLVDLDDGVILDCKYTLFGPTALIGAAEAACDLLIRKNYDQARRLTADLLDKQMRDKQNRPAFPPEAAPELNLLIDAIDAAAETCLAIPFAETYIAPPLDLEAILQNERGGYPAWKELEQPQKIALIEQLIASDVRPYIELDAGGVKILDLINDKDLHIIYEGACTTCHSSTGATLSAIQQILRARIHPDLTVIPVLTH